MRRRMLQRPGPFFRRGAVVEPAEAAGAVVVEAAEAAEAVVAEPAEAAEAVAAETVVVEAGEAA